jgi:hypothetical protein
VKVAFFEYSGKGARLASALTAAGHELVDDAGDVAIVDLDHPDTGGALVERHERVVTYPHGANPILEWDGRPPHPNIRLHLVHGPGHAAVFGLYGHPVPAVAVGFTYCDVVTPAYPEPHRVLFAPAHPMDDGTIDPGLRAANAAALDTLLASGLDLTVRCWGRRSDWGLPDIDEGARYFTWRDGGTLDTSDIDAADLVVADGTVAALAVARGRPTLFVGSHVDLGFPRWGRYGNYFRYPYDIADAPLNELLPLLRWPNAAINRWRDQFVGGPFDADLAVALIEAVAA